MTSTRDDQPVAAGIFDVIGILFKRWYVVGPLLAISIVAAVVRTESIAPEFLAEASLVIVGSSELVAFDPDTGEMEIDEVNPLISLGAALSTVASIAELALSDEQVRQTLEDEGLSTNYTVAAIDDRSPIVAIEVRDRNPDLALTTAERLVELLQQDLSDRQDALGAPDENRLNAAQISSTILGGADYGGKTRARLGFAAAGLLISVLAAFGVESLAQSWRRRSERRIGAAMVATWTFPNQRDLHRWTFERARLIAVIEELNDDPGAGARRVDEVLGDAEMAASPGPIPLVEVYRRVLGPDLEKPEAALALVARGELAVPVVAQILEVGIGEVEERIGARSTGLAGAAPGPGPEAARIAAR